MKTTRRAALKQLRVRMEDPLQHADPPGTINPAKLSTLATSTTSAPCVVGNEKGPDVITWAPKASEVLPSLHLARISTDWDPDHEGALRNKLNQHATWREFEQSHGRSESRLRPSSRARERGFASHSGYFQRQATGVLSPELAVPVDPDADPGSVVVADRAGKTIFDCYLLRANITKNINLFHRHQIVFHQASKIYTLWSREGRVGQRTRGCLLAEAGDLKRLERTFFTIFKERTGVLWKRRYERLLSSPNLYTFVELDYRRRASASALLSRGVAERNYDAVESHANMHDDVRELMETILCGPPASTTEQAGAREEQHQDQQLGDNTSAGSDYTVPYEYLGPWACFLGFKMLQSIHQCLESGRPIRWKTILTISSWYRSQIPFNTRTTAHDRLPVISTYHAIFIELKFLYQLWPQPQVLSLLNDVYTRGTLQLRVHKMLIHPMYHAYSSLRHGFRRMSDSSTDEFRELKNYLIKSCHSLHRLKFELRDIYRVFIKANLPNPYKDWIEGKQQQGNHDPCGEERLLLWHGTPIDSLMGILDLGLQIRRKGFTWSGTLFGNGIYLADASSKSANFSRYQAWNGEAVLLLCEADVGKERIRSTHMMENGHDIVSSSGGKTRCIEGCGMHGPKKWKTITWEMSGAPNSAGVVQMVRR